MINISKEYTIGGKTEENEKTNPNKLEILIETFKRGT